MNLNIDIQNLKEQIHGMLGKRSKSPATAPKQKKSSGSLNKLINPLKDSLAKYTFERETLMGVDITPHYIRVCQMTYSYGQWILNNLASSCIESQFRKYDIQSTPDLYVENLKDLVSKNNIKIKNVAFSLPASSSIIKILNIPDMSDEDFVQAAALGSIWESMVSLDGGIGEYSVYYKILAHNPPKPMPVMEAAPTPEPVQELAPIVEEIPAQAVEFLAPVAEVVSSETVSVEVEAPAIEGIPTELPLDVTPAPEMVAAIETPQEIVIDIASETPVLEASTEIITDAPIVENIIQPETIQPTEGMVETPMDFTMSPEMTFETTPMPIEPLGPTMDVLFVATKLADIYLHSDIIRRAGLNPILADVRCLALKHAFESNPDNLKSVSEPYAFIEFGPDENYIFIVDGDHTDIYNVFVSEDDKNVVIYHSEDITQMQTFAQNFASQTSQILQEHETRCGTGRINNLFVTSSAPLHVNNASSTPLVKTFVENISANLGGYNVSECNFCGHITVPEKFAKKVNAEGNLSAWAPTIGIASRKVDIFGHEKDIMAINKVNLLPEGELYKQSQRMSVISTIAFAAMFILTIFLMGNSYLSVNTFSNSLTSKINTMDKVEAAYNEKVSEAQKLTLIMNQVSSLDGIKNSLPSNQSSILAAYGHITNVIPEGVWLSEVTYTAPNKIEISGNSVNDENILQFVEQLNNGEYFEKLVLKTMQTKEEVADPKAPAMGDAPLVKNFNLEGSVKKNASKVGSEILSSEAKNGN